MPRRPPEPHVGLRVRQLRLATGLTQAELAERVEAAPETISRVERGKLAPSADLVERIASALGVKTDDVLSRTPVKRKIENRLAIQRVVALLEPLTDADVDAVRGAITALLRVGSRVARPR
jgi:transcriptional regulator with XRE-family HTH domain